MAKKSQIQKFREAAKAAEADDSEDRFDASLKALAQKPRETKPAPKVMPKPHK